MNCPVGKLGFISVTRQARSPFSEAHAAGLALAMAKRDAEAGIVCSDPVLQPFDFAVLRYQWTEEAGRDLDTRTAVVLPSRGLDVGWSRLPTDPGEGQLASCTPNTEIDGSGAIYLAHGGDNCTAGVEAVLVDFQKLAGDYPDEISLEVRMRAFWYSQRLSGAVTLQFQTFLGGTMVRDGYDFVNSGGGAVQSLSAVVNVVSEGSSDMDGDDLGRIRYVPAEKTATLILS